MYEQYFSTFSFVDKLSPFCIVRLNDPFAGVEVTIAKVFTVTQQQEIRFDYEVTSIPEDFDKELLQSVEFIDAVKNVFMAILEREMMTYEQQQSGVDQEQTPEGSVSPGPETQEQE